MRPIHGVLASVLLVAGLIGVLAIQPEPADLGGVAHPRFQSMRHGSESTPWRGSTLGWAWALGCAVIIVFGSLLHLGGGRAAGRRSLQLLLLLTVVLHLAAWTWMIVEFRAYQLGAFDARLLGLPRPTAVLLFVFWPISLAYSALFVAGFDRWVLTEDERLRFRALVAKRREEDA